MAARPARSIPDARGPRARTRSRACRLTSSASFDRGPRARTRSRQDTSAAPSHLACTSRWGVTPLSCNQAPISTEVAHQPVHHARAPAADPRAHRTPAERASRCATHRPLPRRKPACPRSARPTAHPLRYAPCGARDPRYGPQLAGAIQRRIHQGGRIGLALVSGDAAPWPRMSERRLGRLPSSDHRARLAPTNIAPVTAHRYWLRNALHPNTT